MRPLACLLFVLVAIGLCAGCGSGARSGSSATGAASSSAANSGQQGLKVITTPKFAPAAGPVRSGTVEVSYVNITIRPDTLRVKAGTTVRWTNLDPIAHNVTSHSGPQRFASANFAHGRTFTVKLTQPGTITYLCTIHPATMNGTIEVVR